MWVLNCGGRFPCGIFDSKGKAEVAIKKYNLNGTLTKYPVNMLVYDWAIENGYPIEVWRDGKAVKQPAITPELIGEYTTAYQEHYHYEED